jgi:hypothetical protein
MADDNVRMIARLAGAAFGWAAIFAMSSVQFCNRVAPER